MSEFAPRVGDRYAVVDDVEAGQVILVLDRWPNVDAAGHLVFSGTAVIRDFPASVFQAFVDQQRAQAGQPARTGRCVSGTCSNPGRC